MIVRTNIQPKVVKSNASLKAVNAKLGVGLDTSRLIYHETPTPATDGVTTLFTLANAYVSGSLQVFLDGLQQIKTTDYTETSANSGTFTMGSAPDSNEVLRVSYIKQ